ncbi:hypothetical protein HDU92_005848 [Lobulomyces angularis]|nr:hypothetical protein HDU92_005848 [Lobulomyces angularis]
MGTMFRGYSHLEYNIVVKVEEDSKTATSRSYWSAHNTFGELTAIGKHGDKFIFDETKGWLFAERVVELRWTKEEGSLVPLIL